MRQTCERQLCQDLVVLQVCATACMPFGACIHTYIYIYVYVYIYIYVYICIYIYMYIWLYASDCEL